MAPQTDPRAVPELTPQEARLQRILKGVVIALAVLILIVLGLIVVKMVGGKKKAPPPPAAAAEQQVAASGGISGTASFGTRAVALKPGSEIVEMTLGAGTLVLQVHGPDGTDELVVLDLVTGAERGRFVLKAD